MLGAVQKARGHIGGRIGHLGCLYVEELANPFDSMALGSGPLVSRRKDVHPGYDPPVVMGVGHVHVVNPYNNVGNPDGWRGRIDICFCACFSAFPN